VTRVSDAKYTHGHHESVLRSHRWRTAENSAGYLLPYLRPGLTILDVGCGPGTITVDVARLVAPGKVVGIDKSAEIVAQAKLDNDEPNLRYLVGDVYALEADQVFDIVHAHQVLQHLPDPVGALVAMRAAGRLVAARDSDYEAMTWHPATPALDRWLDLYRTIARRNGGEPDAGRHLLAWAHAAGFTDVTATSSAWCFASTEERAWWGGLWADRMTSSAIADQVRAEGLATHDDLRNIAAAWRAWSADPDGWFAVLHGEIVCCS
jgi:SAM-dependent methyltransferase